MKHFVYTGEEGLEYILPGQVPFLLINDNVKFHVLVNLIDTACTVYYYLLLHPFNSLFSRTTCPG